MKKQKLLFISLFILGTLNTVSQLFLFTPKVLAAPGTCYQGPLNNVSRLPGCPDPVSEAAARVSYVTEPVATSCYGSPGPVSTTYGTMLRFTEFPCADLALLERNTSSPLCTASGGTWGVEAGGGTPTYVCRCPAPNVYSTGTRQCAPPPPPPSTGGGTTDPGVGIRPGALEGDCDVRVTGGRLDGENCGIIGLLNTIFNFVSGGVAIAVIGNIILAGIQYSAAQGDPSAAAKSKKRITDAVLAFLMYLSLFAFIQWLIPGGVF